jgi:hypothetical protein
MANLCGRGARATIYPALFVLAVCLSFGCEKKTVTPVEPIEQPRITNDEPIQTLAREAAEKVHQALANADASTIEIHLENHDLLPPKAFVYFENAFIAHLATHKISKGSSEWKLEGILSKEMERLTFSFSVAKGQQEIARESASIPNDEWLQNTLTQFAEPEVVHDHSTHQEMAVPTPLAQLDEIPLDVAEDCEGNNCLLLLLYSNRLVARNWQNGSEQRIPLQSTTQRSRAPSGKILLFDDSIFISTNNLAAPLILDHKLNPAKGTMPARFPQPIPGRNTYLLSDGEFYDYEKLGSAGLAVIDNKYHLQIADHGKLISTDQHVGGSLSVSLPYIYVTSAALPNQLKDSILKFRYENDSFSLVDTKTFDGSVYDIAITDLNRDHKPEMLVTLRTPRGIFIEVYELF